MSEDHPQVEIGSARAMAAVRDLDWPGACPLPESTKAELLWEGSAPFWRLGDGADSALVDARSGAVVAGDLPAAAGPARVRLYLLLGLSILAVFLAGMSLLSLAQLSLQAGVLTGSRLAWLCVGLAAAATGFGLLLWHVLPGAFAEPARRLQTGRIRVPVSEDWRLIARCLGLAFGIVLIANLLRLALVFVNLIYAFVPGLEYGYADFLLSMVQTALVYALFRHAQVLGRKARSPGGEGPRAEGSAGGDSSRAFDLVRVSIHVAILSMLGALLGSLLALGFPDLVARLGWGRVPYPDFLLHGAQLGAFVALHLSPTPAYARGTLSVGMVAHAFGKHFLPPYFTALLVLGAVFLADLPIVWRARAGGGGELAWPAARSAWGFALGALAGSLAGRLLGWLCFVATGLGGLVAGEIIGSLVGATALYMGQRRLTGREEGLLAALIPRYRGSAILAALCGLVAAVLFAALWADLSIRMNVELRMPLILGGVLCGVAVLGFSGELGRWLSRALAGLATLLCFYVCKVFLLVHFMGRALADNYGQGVIPGIEIRYREPWLATLADIHRMVDGSDLIWLALALLLAVHLAGHRRAVTAAG
ncbi:MAG: hypothetical protein JXR96_20635 [Deltaproteobacteria bacterium]|nr:hypothetical protein [Deltaproteobacteria bacterium]